MIMNGNGTGIAIGTVALKSDTETTIGTMSMIVGLQKNIAEAIETGTETIARRDMNLTKDIETRIGKEGRRSIETTVTAMKSGNGIRMQKVWMTE